MRRASVPPVFQKSSGCKAGSPRSIHRANLPITWDDFGDVSYGLKPKGNNLLLTMIQRGLPNREIPDREFVVMFAAGSRVHLNILLACVTGKNPLLFWNGWSRMQKEYDKRIPN